MKLIETDTFIVTILTLALFSLVESLEASPIQLSTDIGAGVDNIRAQVEHP